MLRGIEQAIGNDGYFPSREDVESTNELLSRLPHLEKVVFESRENQEATSSMHEVADLLSNVADKIHIWTRNEARDYARGAYRKGLPSADQLPISPDAYVNYLCRCMIG